jgi:hypothetical protein
MLHHVSGPTTPAEALTWIQEAVAGGRYLVLEPHFSRRCQQRGVTLPDWKRAIRLARACVQYGGRVATCGGTNWRVTGPDIEGDDLTIGVEAFRDQVGKRALLITVL